MIESDEQGEWEVTECKKCNIRVLVKPSQAFLDWQISQPKFIPATTRNLISEIDILKTRVAQLEEK